jgi:hypothetical protein
LTRSSNLLNCSFHSTSLQGIAQGVMRLEKDMLI